MRTAIFLILMLFVAVMAPGCDGDVTPGPDADVVSGDVDSPYLPDTLAPDAGDTDDDAGDTVEPIYPGHECQQDEQCSTGLCYGKATSQGFFEPTLCQTRCIALNDFSKYCTSDNDCCEGFCCRKCGWREGLCVTQ